MTLAFCGIPQFEFDFVAYHNLILWFVAYHKTTFEFCGNLFKYLKKGLRRDGEFFKMKKKKKNTFKYFISDKKKTG
jgi:hypothetical protein